jgi:hypothetical protein
VRLMPIVKGSLKQRFIHRQGCPGDLVNVRNSNGLKERMQDSSPPPLRTTTELSSDVPCSAFNAGCSAVSAIFIVIAGNARDQPVIVSALCGGEASSEPGIAPYSSRTSTGNHVGWLESRRLVG